MESIVRTSADGAGRRFRGDAGAGLVEYALLVALIAVVCIVGRDLLPAGDQQQHLEVSLVDPCSRSGAHGRGGTCEEVERTFRPHAASSVDPVARSVPNARSAPRAWAVDPAVAAEHGAVA